MIHKLHSNIVLKKKRIVLDGFFFRSVKYKNQTSNEQLIQSQNLLN